ncbi:MAG: prenyltransferase/squalene oxidase repeat-containing protein [Gemmatimonas sp.]
MRIDTAIRAIAAAPLLWRAAMGQRRPADPGVRLRAAADWLLEAQRAAGGTGYAHSFNLLRGWQRPYPETTGYILPTLRRVAALTGNAAYRHSIAAASRWLVSIQQPDGSFHDLHGRPQVFDTGQILIGLNDLAERAADLADRGALARAARWLVSVQEANGSFVRHAYNGIPHSYYSRVGAALTIAGRILDDAAVRESGVRNLRWTVAQQEANGFFRHLSFDEESPPYLHTMVYVIEGLLDGAEETAETAFADAALAFADALRRIAERDGALRSQYRSDYGVANHELCLTGLAQWAGVCFRLARRTGDATWREQAGKSLDFVETRQILSDDSRLHGGVPGSAPITGRYMRAAIPNWGVKFFIDALLEDGPEAVLS